jgi:hypothetical protein
MGETRKLAATVAAEFGAICAAILALPLVPFESAEAHDLNCYGMPISEAEKLGCCGVGDAHFGEAWQFYEDKDGFWHYLVAGEDFRLVRGVPNNLNKIEPLPAWTDVIQFGSASGAMRRRFWFLGKSATA